MAAGRSGRSNFIWAENVDNFAGKCSARPPSRRCQAGRVTESDPVFLVAFGRGQTCAALAKKAGFEELGGWKT